LALINFASISSDLSKMNKGHRGFLLSVLFLDRTDIDPGRKAKMDKTQNPIARFWSILNIQAKLFITPPVFDDPEKNLNARSSFFLAGIGFSTSILVFLIFEFFAPENTVRLLIIASAALLSLVPVFLLRKGYVRTAIFFQAGIVWMGVVANAFFTGGVRSIGFIGGTIAAMLILGIALEWRSTLLLISTSILAAGILAWVESQGLIDPSRVTEKPVVLIASYASFLLVLAGLLYVTHRNVTQALANANQELANRQQADARLRSIFENSPDLIVEIDREGTILLSNRNAAYFQGKRVSEFLSPQVDQQIREIAEQVFELGQQITVEMPTREEDGSSKWYSIRMGPVPSGGKIAKAVAVVSNIHAQKEAELRSQKNTEQLTTIVEISHAVSTLQDLESVLEIIYQQVQRIAPVDAFFISLFDAERNELTFPLTYDMGVKYYEPNMKLRPDSRLSLVIQSGQPYRLHRTAEEVAEAERIGRGMGNMQRKSGSLLYMPLWQANKVIGVLSLQSYALYTYPDELVNILKGVADQAAIAIQNSRLYTNVQLELEERKRAEEVREQLIYELEQKNAELERFTYTVSHDLRSPIVTIKGFVGMLKKDLQENHLDRVQSDIQRISNAASRMDILLSDLLELSRIGRIINPPVEIDPDQLIQEALDILDAHIRAKNITVKILPEIPKLYGDRLRLREVFENLLGNAAKYMGDQTIPMIEIGARKHEKWQAFYVKDNGIGIDPQYHTRIFNLFEKLDPAVEGTGIGLTIVKRIIEVHGGKIWVESSGLGNGATFLFILPDRQT
jgi:PAS domain S-box-containing protein